MLSAWFRGRRARVETSAARSPAPAEAALLAAVEAIQARVARGFASEPPAILDLAQKSVPVLIAARPQFLDDKIPNPTPLAWLTTALDALETWPDPLPIPPGAPKLAWRYLLFLRMAFDALEAAYDVVWQRGWATVCPLTDAPDPFAAPRPLRPARDHNPPSSAGLGALLVGIRLPECLEYLYEAQAAGVDWVHAADFWRAFNIAPAPQPGPEPPLAHAPALKPAANAGTTPSAATVSTASAPTQQHPAANAGTTPNAVTPLAKTKTPPAASVPAPPVATPQADTGTPAPLDDPLAGSVRATLASWVTSPSFNRQSGDGWLLDDLYVVAKSFAEALQTQAWVAAQPALSNRKALYRQLAEWGLILPHGGQRVWPLFVTEQGQTHPRYVSALKLAPSLYAELEIGAPFNGTLCPARARRSAWR